MACDPPDIKSPNVVLVDMDGVLADFRGRFDQIWQDSYPDQLYVPSSEHTGFFITESYPDEMTPMIHAVWNAPGFVASLPLMPNAQEGIALLEEKGKDVVICTSALPDNPNCIQEKYDWVVRYFGARHAKKIIVTSDKTIILGEWLIDDQPEVKGRVARPEWKHVIFEAACNRHINDRRRRLTCWAALPEFLAGLPPLSFDF